MSAGKHRRRRETPVDEHDIDPSTYFAGHESGRADRKVQQLCKEVERTLGYALPACGDPLLRELTVVAVEPAPDGARLMVTVAAAPSTLAAGVDVLMERLRGVRGALRSEIAAAIQRKRTPELAFQVVTPTAASASSMDDEVQS
jgi:ribosome-binding factor A